MLGFIWIPLAEGAQGQGGECNLNTNGAYRTVVGKMPKRFFDERRIRAALMELVHGPNDLDAWAYDHGAEASADLYGRISRVSERYHDLFPEGGRWEERLTETECGEVKAPWPTMRAADYGEPLEWLYAGEPIVDKVPGGEDSAGLRTGIADPGAMLDRYLKVSGGRAMPTAWFVSFLDHFDPVARFTAVPHRLPPTPLAIRPSVAYRPQQIREPISPAKRAKRQLVAAGIGIAGAAAAVAWAVRR